MQSGRPPESDQPSGWLPESGCPLGRQSGSLPRLRAPAARGPRGACLAVDSDRLLAALVSAGAGVSRFEVVEPSLHSIFVARVGEEAASAPARGDA